MPPSSRFLKAVRSNFTDTFGVLAGTLERAEEEYRTTVRLITTKYGRSKYDAMNALL